MGIMGVEIENDEVSTSQYTNFKPNMVVVGIGGGGGNAVSHMAKANILDVRTICINTDAQALSKTTADCKVQIGSKMTAGLGCGADPSKGKAAAEEDIDKIRDALMGNDIVFITAGEGGGTGTGGAPVVAQVARELNILSIAIVTKPFSYEGHKRAQQAEEGIKELAKYADTLIVVPNDKLLQVLGKKVSVLTAFAEVNDVLRKAVRGISGSLLKEGLINLDFNDLKKCMANGGSAIIGIGVGKGPERAQEAAQQAIVCPLLDDVDLKGASSIFLNVEAPQDLGMDELDLINRTINEYAGSNAEIISGLSYYDEDSATKDVPEGEGEVRVTVIATGIGRKEDESQSSNLESVVLNPIEGINLDDIISADSSIFIKDEGAGDDNLETPAYFRKQAD